MMILMIVDEPEEKRKFLILYETYRYLMLKVAVDILHDYQLAEDAVQEAFVRVAKHMEQIGQPDDEKPLTYMAPEEDYDVLNILKNLPPKYRDIFLLKYSAHLENAEIARVCSIREGTVRQRLEEHVGKDYVFSNSTDHDAISNIVQKYFAYY